MVIRKYKGYEVSADPYEAADGGYIPNATITLHSGRYSDDVMVNGEEIFQDYDDAVEESFRLAQNRMK